MHPTEHEIWNLLRLLSKIDDGEAAAFADAAAENLRRLVGTGIFGSLAGPPLALMQVITNDPAMKESDRIVAKVLLTAFDPGYGHARLSKHQMSIRTGFSVTKVRTALRRLVEAGYFIAVPPNKKEWDDGDFTVKHQPCFDALDSGRDPVA
ncbi:hypothetical protein CWO91_26730 [Bradyrhizobium genosp. SA-3]|uniref:hypothetical protein n=1 Tax=Bradyrhizobium genosp. SA-3 TaxID=508868 RepID=UPI001028C80C|nr:hypothetical protein [Bradyrhizobium genosp. SA-3]RZN07597.1 hypothetical protein CWO91_26730 [Bradyrhizobium genosp. SA-3]